MNKTLLLLPLFPAWLAGQSSAPPLPQAPTTKLIHVRFAVPTSIAELLNSTGSQAAANNMMKVIVVRGTPDRIASAEQLIGEMDQAPPAKRERDVEVTTFVIAASDKVLPQAAMPAAMEPVVKQLRAMFRYGNYEVLESVLTRAREGNPASTQGRLRGIEEDKENRRTTYNIEYVTSAAADSNAKEGVRFEKFKFQADKPGERSVSIESSFSVREGQKVVVGNTNVEDGSSAFFVVLTARIVE